jgi:putative protein-disulfide isomerase
MCSWCWGYRPTWDALQQSLPSFIKVEYVAGGLAPDSDEPMPAAMRATLQNHWRTIETKLGTSFNFDFWQENTPRRSTYNACRAAIAADKQGCQKAMIDAIQRAYYLRAMNPSNVTTLIGLAEELSQQKSLNLDLTQFIEDVSSDDVESTLLQQIHAARQLSQQGFPSLVLEVNGIYHQISVNYEDYQQTLIEINNKVNG